MADIIMELVKEECPAGESAPPSASVWLRPLWQFSYPLRSPNGIIRIRYRNHSQNVFI